MKAAALPCYFLGANTPDGFVNCFDDLCDLQSIKECILVKGGAGTGKSSLMKRISAHYEALGYPAQFFYCSADPNSLDGLLIPDLSFAMVDATAPHNRDAVFPGGVERLIDMAQFLDRDYLRARRSLFFTLLTQKSAHYENASRYITAIKPLRTARCAILQAALQQSRLNALGKRLCKIELPEQSRTGSIHTRYLTTLCSRGVVSLFDTLCSLSRIYVLHDTHGISPWLLRPISEEAARRGYDVIACPDPRSPDAGPEHLVIPELSLAFVTANTDHPYEGEVVRTINLDRYLHVDLIRKNRSRLRFTRRCEEALLEEAVTCLSLAAKAHGEIEQMYIAAMDFDAVNRFQEELLLELDALLLGHQN